MAANHDNPKLGKMHPPKPSPRRVGREPHERPAEPRPARRVGRRVETAHLIEIISTSLLSAESPDFDRRINGTLALIGEFARADRASVFLISADQQTAVKTYGWRRAGITPRIEDVRELPCDTYPWAMTQLCQQGAIRVPRVADLPAEAACERAVFEGLGVKSFVAIPMIRDGNLEGFVSLTSDQCATEWSETDLRLLRLGGVVVQSALLQERAHRSLKSADAHFRTIFDSCPIGIALIRRGVVLEANEACARMFSHPEAANLVGVSVLDCMAPECRDEVAAKIVQQPRADAPWVFYEGMGLTMHGERIVVSVAATSIQLPDGPARVAFITDVTECRNATGALHNEHDFLSSVLETVDVLVVVFDCHFRIVRVNHTYEKVTEYSFADVAGKRVRDLPLPQRVIASLEAILVRSLHGEKVEAYDSEFPSRTGGTKTIRWSLATVRDGRGGVEYVIATGMDMTAQREAERAVRESETRFRSLFEDSPVSLWIEDFSAVLDRLNATGATNAEELRARFAADPGLAATCAGLAQVVDVNRQTLLMYGSGSRDDFVPNATWHFTADAYECLKDALVALFAGGEVYRGEAIHCDRDGNPLCVRVSWSIPPGYTETWRRVIVCIEDITERKAAEQRLLAYQADLRALALQLSVTAEDERRRAAGDLHDSVGQTLAVCKIKLGQLRDAMPSEDLAQAVAEVRDLLDEALRETRSLVVQLSPLILHELGLVPAVEWLTEEIQRRYGISVTLHDDGAPKPLADDLAALLFQVVRELLANAGKHAQARNVEVTIERVGDRIRITVVDDGVGFNMAEMANAGSEGGRFGLLSIRERMRQSRGGLFTISAAPGCGTRATLVAPLTLNGVTQREEAQ